MAFHWLVVADGAGARIYASDELLDTLTPVDQLHHQHGHVTHGDGQVTTHLPGAGANAHDAHHDGARETEERFARALARLVDDGERKHAFERVILVAPPRFLGALRHELGAAAARRVVASIHHDWTKLGVRDLAERVRAELPPTAGR